MCAVYSYGKDWSQMCHCCCFLVYRRKTCTSMRAERSSVSQKHSGIWVGITHTITESNLWGTALAVANYLLQFLWKYIILPVQLRIFQYVWLPATKHYKIFVVVFHFSTNSLRGNLKSFTQIYLVWNYGTFYKYKH